VELFTLNRQFLKVDVIDKFKSAIWTERYYGDGDITLSVPISQEAVAQLKPGTFLGLVGSKEIMILETDEIKDGLLTVTGISLEQWLNNRFIRATAAHEDRYWAISGLAPGRTLVYIVQQTCVDGPFFWYPGGGGINNGIDNMAELKVPGLSTGDSPPGFAISVGVPYGPVYDALKEIATTYEVGMSLTLESADEESYSLVFQSYKGQDRTSSQHVNPTVRFSPKMDSLTKINELQSIAGFKTMTYSFAPSNPGGLATTPGFDRLTSVDEDFSGFDMRAMLVFADDLTTDQVGGDAGYLQDILNTRAADALDNNKYVKAVDGEVVPDVQFKFGIDYNLGDLVEVEGYSGIVQDARVTEYIRSQDENGERAYPTLTMK
jgi:hypothetical protein